MRDCDPSGTVWRTWWVGLWRKQDSEAEVGVLGRRLPSALSGLPCPWPDAGAWVAAWVCLPAVRQLVYEPKAGFKRKAGL